MPTSDGLPKPDELFAPATSGVVFPEDWACVTHVGIRHGGKSEVRWYTLSGAVIRRVLPASADLRKGIRLYVSVRPFPGDSQFRAQSIDPAFVTSLEWSGDAGVQKADVELSKDYR